MCALKKCSQKVPAIAPPPGPRKAPQNTVFAHTKTESAQGPGGNGSGQRRDQNSLRGWDGVFGVLASTGSMRRGCLEGLAAGTMGALLLALAVKIHAVVDDTSCASEVSEAQLCPACAQMAATIKSKSSEINDVADSHATKEVMSQAALMLSLWVSRTNATTTRKLHLRPPPLVSL
jgi:hypothetical protein